MRNLGGSPAHFATNPALQPARTGSATASTHATRDRDLVPGVCRGKAHRHENLGYAGRRALSRNWSGETLADHRADRKPWLTAMLTSRRARTPSTTAGSASTPRPRLPFGSCTSSPIAAERAGHSVGGAAAALRQVPGRGHRYRQQADRSRARGGSVSSKKPRDVILHISHALPLRAASGGIWLQLIAAAAG
jgi:hypothetical protein